MKRIASKKLTLDLETIKSLVDVIGGNAAGVRTSCVPACTQNPKTGGGNTRTTGGDPQSSPIHTCLPSRANCIP